MNRSDWQTPAMRLCFWLVGLALALVLWIASCNGAGDIDADAATLDAGPDVGIEQEAGTDLDTETEFETDTDTGPDTDPPPEVKCRLFPWGDSPCTKGQTVTDWSVNCYLDINMDGIIDDVWFPISMHDLHCGGAQSLVIAIAEPRSTVSDEWVLRLVAEAAKIRQYGGLIMIAYPFEPEPHAYLRYAAGVEVDYVTSEVPPCDYYELPMGAVIDLETMTVVEKAHRLHARIILDAVILAGIY